MVSKDVWNSSLMKLPENTLFILLKNWLGEIITPFDKHKLLAKLNNWLKDNKIDIVSCIDTQEVELISLLIYSDGLSEMEIFNCLKHTSNEMLLREMLWNLKDRLILFNDEIRGKRLYLVNPILQETIISMFDIADIVLPSNKIKVPDIASKFIFSKKMVNALFSLAWNNNNLFLSNGSVKKKWINKFNSIICLEEDEINATSISLFWQVMENIGITQQHGENISININNFFELNNSKNYKLFLLTKIFNQFPEDRIYNLFSSLLTITPPNLQYEKETLIRWIYLFLCKWFRGRDIPDPNLFFDLLIKVNIIKKYNDNFYIEKESVTQDQENSLLITPSSEIHISSNYKISSLLPFITTPEKLDNHNIYMLNKKSIQLCMDCNFNAKQIKTFIEEESGSELHQNLSVLIDEAEEEHKSLKVMEGIVLLADQEKQEIIDNSDFLQPYIIARPAPGVYILQPDSNDKWETALNNAGFNHVARFRNVKKNINIPFIREEPISKIEPPIKIKQSDQKSKIQRLTEKIKESEDTNIVDSNLVRINNKMILEENQIINIDYRQEIREAGGLDFNAKKRLIQSAIDSGKDRLELIVASRDAAKKVYTIYPDSVITEEETVMIQGRSYPDNKPFSFPVRKILRVRKIPVSITGG